MRFYLILSFILAGFIPFLSINSHEDIQSISFTDFPTTWEGKNLKRLPLTLKEERFYQNFPGYTAKLSDGNTLYIFRWLVQPTRQLHPASDCFKGMGYQIKPLPLAVDKKKHLWGRFQATYQQEQFEVTERIYTHSGQSWSDVSSWYWATLLGQTKGPWWAVTIIKKTLY